MKPVLAPDYSEGVDKYSNVARYLVGDGEYIPLEIHTISKEVPEERHEQIIAERLHKRILNYIGAHEAKVRRAQKVLRTNRIDPPDRQQGETK